MSDRGGFDKELFARLIIKAQGNRSLNQYARDTGVSAAHISRLSRGLIDAPPNPQLIEKLASMTQNGVTYEDLLGAAGHIQEPSALEYLKWIADHPAEIKKALTEGAARFMLPFAALAAMGTGATANIPEASTEYLSDAIIPASQVMSIPILGTIKAGTPLLVQESYEGYLEVPDYIKADFVLQVTGDSMVGAGILDGDYAVCRETQEANSGQIVVALNDLATGFSEATLKYYFDNGKGLTLRAANPQYSDIDMKKEGYRIAGVMTGLVRKETPSYSTYRDYLTIGGNEDWAEIIELASSAGIRTNQVKEILAAQIEIAKRLKGG